jgi:hypothetical protein
MKPTYQIEYFNKLWNDWIAFDQLFYNTQEQAQKRVDEYRQHKTGIKIRIIQTNILNEKPKRIRTKNLGRKVTVEKA